MLRRVDVPDLVGQELASHSSVHPGLFGRVEVGSVQGDPEALRRLLDGLIRHAARTAPAWGRITVHVRKAGDEVVFRVSHPGPPPADGDPALVEAADLVHGWGGRLGLEDGPSAVWFTVSADR